MPILIVNGTADTLVPPELNLPLLEEALKKQGNTQFSIIKPDKVGHHYFVIEDNNTEKSTYFL